MCFGGPKNLMFFDGPFPSWNLMCFDGPKNLMCFDGPSKHMSPEFSITLLYKQNGDPPLGTTSLKSRAGEICVIQGVGLFQIS